MLSTMLIRYSSHLIVIFMKTTHFFAFTTTDGTIGAAFLADGAVVVLSDLAGAPFPGTEGGGPVID